MRTYICHISILNPLRHTRIYYKLARTQAAAGYRVGILGQGEKNATQDPSGVEMFPIGQFSRLSYRRIFAPIWLLPQAIKQRAEVYVIHSPELLPLAWVLKKIRKSVIFYDMHENYVENLHFGLHWRGGMGKRLGSMIHAIESWAKGWLDGVTFAEEIFQQHLPMEEGKGFLLPNLFSVYASEDSEPNPNELLPPNPYLLYSGTLAAERGLWDTFACWELLSQTLSLDLVIAGHTHSAELFAQLKAKIAQHPLKERIHLIGGNTFVPYHQIVHLIRHAYAGTALYHPHPQNLGRFPTKLYEYMAAARPLIFWPQPAWETRNQHQPFGFSWKPGAAITSLVEGLKNWQNPDLPPEGYSWQALEPLYLDWLQKRLTSSIR